MKKKKIIFVNRDDFLEKNKRFRRNKISTSWWKWDTKWTKFERKAIEKIQKSKVASKFNNICNKYVLKIISIMKQMIPSINAMNQC